MMLAIIAVITAAGYSFVQQQKHIVIEEARLDLATIVDLKVSQLIEWRKERLLEATAINTNTMVARRIKSYLSDREKTGALEEIQEWMAGLQNTTGYNNLILFTPRGEVLSSALPIIKPLAGDREIINSAAQRNEVILSDLHIHKDSGDFDINLAIPIIDPDGDRNKCIAIIAIDINPITKLYPLFRTWPAPSRTGENQLVRHDGDDVLFLNELRFRDKSALTLREPLTRKNMPEVRAALGQEGVFEGLDYRGVAVIAAVRTVPNSPWAIVSKVDTLEVLEPVSSRIWYVVSTCLIIFITLSLAASLWWRKKREAYLYRQYESELKYNRELKQAEQSLQEINNSLEERVATRTKELSDSNTKLRQEIAERKQIEELLRKQYQAILQSPVAIIITDLEGSIEFVNPKFSEYSGYSYEEVIGQNPRILKSESTPPEIHKKLWETITAGDVWEGRLCNRKKNGDIYWEYAKILPIKDQNGTITNFMAFKEDITKHRQLEQKLLRTGKLETIGQFVGGVAHEVRNPLNAILSISEALFREKEIEDNPEFAPYIQHIRTQVNRLAHLMNELLDLGKTTPTSSIHAVPLTEVCQEAIDLWISSGSARKIPVTLTTDLDPLTCVMADRGRLVQIIFNLMENAAQHSPDDSTITISLIKCDDGGPNIPMTTIRIRDTGSGIRPENLDQIFDPFYTGRTGGTGLGLALVKHFVEDMMGTVVLFNNDPPPGCTAEVHIPTALEKQA